MSGFLYLLRADSDMRFSSRMEKTRFFKTIQESIFCESVIVGVVLIALGMLIAFGFMYKVLDIKGFFVGSPLIAIGVGFVLHALVVRFIGYKALTVTKL